MWVFAVHRRSEAGRAELTRQLEDARAEIARLKQELAALVAHKPSDGEGPLRRRIEELQQQVEEGRKEVMRLRQGLGAGEGKEERMHALSREMELLSAARQQLQDTVNMQQNEIARLVEQYVTTI
jgi:chromosome segregation ATPase